MPIPPDATAVHGITDDMVKDCPTFAQMANTFLPYFTSAGALVGYNFSFDVSFLTAAFARVGLDFPKDKPIIDPFTMWAALERRSLMNAYKRYVNSEGFDNAHSAGADVSATYSVLRHMLVHHKLDELDYEQLADLSNPDRHRELGCKHFLWNDTGTDVVYGFGKHKGVSVFKETGYLKWMGNTDFDKPVKTALSVITKACRQPDKIAAIKLVYPFRKADK
jgi:DNA polymerase-3 subunit epsilon